MHSHMAVNDDAKKKPHIITYYNKYKAGIDTMDQMISRYTTQHRTLRWPLSYVFQHVIRYLIRFLSNLL